MPVLETIAAANAAFAVIKQVVENSGEIARAGKAIAAFVTGKEELQRQVAGKDKNKSSGNDLEAFMALEQIREKETQLKELMIYSGRPGLYTDYVKFCAQARKARREEEKAAEKKRQKRFVIIAVGGLTLVGFAAIAFIVMLLVFNVNASTQ
tara:strand:- start:132 stop:587 length:456 start_codon:yes stop_codon:yes gene_type:complete